MVGIKEPSVASIICNLVIVCSCDAHIVLVGQLIGEVKCPSCNQGWQCDEMNFKRTKDAEGQTHIHLDAVVNPTQSVLLAGSVSEVH